MIIKTKKYQLPKNTYIKLAMTSALKRQWWVGLIYVGLMAGYFLAPSIWWFIGPSIALVLYLLFWFIQFTGVTQLEQGKLLFEKMSYEISSQQVLLKLNAKQGMPIKWEQIKRAQIGKDYFVLYLSKAQFIYLPFKILNNNNDIKFLETVLKRKGYVKG